VRVGVESKADFRIHTLKGGVLAGFRDRVLPTGGEGKGMHSSWLACPLSLNGGIRHA